MCVCARARVCVYTYIYDPGECYVRADNIKSRNASE